MGCDFEDIATPRSGSGEFPFSPVTAGETPYAKDGSVLTVLTAYNGLNNPTGWLGVNDTSLVLLLTHGGNRVRFTGDLNQLLGAWLAANEPRVRATLLKVPHHGTEPVAPDAFFTAVNASGVLVPSPKLLWESERSARVRNYFSGRGIPTWVNGIDGEVVVDLFQGFYLIRPEHGWPSWGVAGSVGSTN